LGSYFYIILINKKREIMKSCIICAIKGKVGFEINREGICETCSEKGYWMDPIGTVHSPGDDPAKAYE